MNRAYQKGVSLYEVEQTRRSKLREVTPPKHMQAADVYGQGLAKDERGNPFDNHVSNFPTYNQRTQKRLHDLNMAQQSAAKQKLGYHLRAYQGPAANGATMSFNNLEERDDLMSTHMSKPGDPQHQARVNNNEGPIRNNSVSRSPPQMKFMQNPSFSNALNEPALLDAA